MRPARVAGVRAGDRRRDDDAPVARLLHVRQRFLHHGERTVRVDGEHGVPLLVAHVLERAVGEYTGVGTDNVDAAIALDDVPVKVADGVARGDVDKQGVRAEFFGGFVCGLLVEVSDDDGRAGLAQGADDTAADAGGTAGDDGNLVLKIEHVKLLSG